MGEKGDATAEKMADKFQEKLCQELLSRSLDAWQEWAKEMKVTREKEQAAAKHEEELEALKSASREKGDATAEKIADKFQEKLCQELLSRSLDAWQEWAKEMKVKREKEQ